jgi:predicted nucleotidyltransferase
MLDARHLLTVLCEAEVEFVVVGGMAAVAQGSAYITVDLDVCYARHSTNLQRVSHALRPLQPQLRGAPAGLPFVLDADTLKAGLNFTLITDAGDIDLLGEVSGLGFYEQVKKQAEEVEVFGHRLWVLTIEGLIQSKQAAGREKDLRLIPELRALQALREQSEKDENS